MVHDVRLTHIDINYITASLPLATLRKNLSFFNLHLHFEGTSAIIMVDAFLDQQSSGISDVNSASEEVQANG